MWDIKHTIATITMLFLTSVAIANNEQPMKDFRVSYTVENKYVTGGKAHFSVKTAENDGAQVQFATEPTGVFRFSKKGSIRETSTITSLSNPPIPTTYSYENLAENSNSFEVTYNHSNNTGQLTTHQGSVEEFEFETGTLDRVTAILATMLKLRDEPELTEFPMQMFDKQNIRTINHEVLGEKTINTILGRLEAKQVKRQRENSSRHQLTWFAPIGPNDLPIPVQIEQYKRGKLSVRLRLTDLHISK